MFKAKDLKARQGRLIRETTADFVVVERGEERTETIRVKYFMLSIAEGASHRAKIAALGDGVLWSDLLVPLVAELPDFVDEKNKPVKVTKEFLEDLNTINLQAIFYAIQQDITPKFPPSRPRGG